MERLSRDMAGRPRLRRGTVSVGLAGSMFAPGRGRTLLPATALGAQRTALMSPSHTQALALAFVPFAVSMSFTPGPNNLMLASAGARFGFARTAPHIAGVVIGFSIMTTLVGLGIAGLIASVPLVYVGMKYAAIAYLLFLSWKIATSDCAKNKAGEPRPMTFLQAMGFQWINPKAWIIALSGVTTYTDPHAPLAVQLFTLTLILTLVGVASTTAWAAFGQMIRRYLTTSLRRRAFNLSMALLLLVSIIPVMIEP